jgi:hypothetical protein
MRTRASAKFLSTAEKANIVIACAMRSGADLDAHAAGDSRHELKAGNRRDAGRRKTP